MTLAEIARLDDVQISRCLNLPRDRRGNLLRRDSELPPGVEVDDDGMRVITNNCGYGAAFVKAKVHHGMDAEDAKKQYQQWWAREYQHSSYAQ